MTRYERDTVGISGRGRPSRPSMLFGASSPSKAEEIWRERQLGDVSEGTANSQKMRLRRANKLTKRGEIEHANSVPV